MEGSTGIGSVVTAITSGLTADALYGVFAQVVPIIITTVLVSLGFYLFRKVFKKASKAKAGV